MLERSMKHEACVYDLLIYFVFILLQFLCSEHRKLQQTTFREHAPRKLNVVMHKCCAATPQYAMHDADLITYHYH